MDEESVRKIVNEEAERNLPVRYDNHQGGNEVSVKNLAEFADAGRKLKGAFESPIESAIVTKFGDTIIDKIMSSPNEQRSSKASFFDSGFMISVGQQLPNIIPSIIQQVGKNNVDSFFNTVLGGGNKNQPNQLQLSNDQTVEDIIMSLNVDDPADLHKYMSAFNVENMEDAKKELVEKRQYIMSKMQENQQNQQMPQPVQNQHNQPNANENTLQEQNQFMNNVINALKTDQDNIKNLNQHLEESNKILTDTISEMNIKFNEKMLEMENIMIHGKKNSYSDSIETVDDKEDKQENIEEAEIIDEPESEIKETNKIDEIETKVEAEIEIIDTNTVKANFE